MSEIGIMQVPIELPEKATYIVIFTNEETVGDGAVWNIKDGKIDLTHACRDLSEGLKAELGPAVIIEMDKARTAISDRVKRGMEVNAKMKELGIT